MISNENTSDIELPQYLADAAENIGNAIRFESEENWEEVGQSISITYTFYYLLHIFDVLIGVLLLLLKFRLYPAIEVLLERC